MEKDKDLKDLSEQIKDMVSLKDIEECVDILKKIFDEEKVISKRGRIEFSSVYLQCIQFISLYKAKEIKTNKQYPTEIKSHFSLINWFKRIFK